MHSLAKINPDGVVKVNRESHSCLNIITMIEQVPSNKSSCLLKNILLNAQPLQLFTMNIKTEII